MFPRIRSNPDERALAERLQAEARQTRPAFSQTLHEQVWGALATRPAPRAVTAGRRHARLVLAALAAAALLALCATLAWYRTGARPGAELRSGPGIALLPASVDRGIEEVGALAGQVIAAEPWTTLEHDARLALAALAESFPLRSSRLQLLRGAMHEESRPAGGTN